MGEGYAEDVLAHVLYLGAAGALVVVLVVGNLVAERLTSASGEGVTTGVRRGAQAMLSLSLLLSLLGTHAALRRPPYERWLNSRPLRADLGVPAAWPATGWSTGVDRRGMPVLYRDLRVGGQSLRVYRHTYPEGFPWTHVCWLGVSLHAPPSEGSIGAHECTRPTPFDGARLLVRRDDARGLWVVDYEGRHYSGVFTDLGTRVEPSYAAILSSAAPPISWVVTSWVAALLAIALLRARTRVSSSASLVAPYRTQPAAAEPDEAARLREAFALTICALHSAPLAAYFLRAWLG